jgi:hypothetical protein
MLTATKEKPSTVVVVISLEDNSQSETRYIVGKTVPEVVSELFGEKPVKERKTRKPRIPKSDKPALPPASQESEPAPGETATKTEKPHRRIMPD